ncbi:MAG TPA: hypothetical protein PKE12_09055 [Kiritimatiellia bacterium]|nr:hypothetical protein [Kiritimatiellia bacterium]
MNPNLRATLSRTLVRIARAIGSPIRDVYSGEVIGRGLVFAFGGRIWVIGVEENLVPVFTPQRRLTYWRQQIGFTRHPPVDFPRETRP